MTPTGTQFALSFGGQAAVVTEVGATLRRYEVDGHPVVDGFDERSRPDGARGQVLAPWPNRVEAGRYRFDGTEQQLALTEPDKGHAIHGLVRWVGWECVEHVQSRVSLRTTVWPQPGYPGLLALGIEYALGDTGLRVSMTATNTGTAPAPYGVGHHPYLTVGAPVDQTTVTIPAGTRLLTDERSIPVGAEDVAGTAYDFRTPREVGALQLDTCYTDLLPDADGYVRVHLEHGGRRVTLWGDRTVRCLQVYSGDTLPDPARRRQGLAVEPMSCPPDAFNSGAEVVVLDPGQEHRLTWGLLAG